MTPLPTVLLIDDEASIRLPLRRALKYVGYRVLEASDGQEGLELLARRRNEISPVVVDHHMPRKSGAETVRARCSQSDRPPIIMMSGFPFAETGITDACRCDPDRFLRKPFELLELVHAARALIGPGHRATA